MTRHLVQQLISPGLAVWQSALAAQSLLPLATPAGHRAVRHLLATATIVASLLLLTAATRPAWGVALIANGVTPAVTDLVNDPQRFYSFDPGVITWKMTQEFRDVFSHPQAQNQVRLAFNEWQTASHPTLRSRNPALPFGWTRYNGPQDMFDLQSIMIHEIGHALGSQHPDAAWFNGDPQYMMNFHPDGSGGWTPAAPGVREVMNEGNAIKSFGGTKGLMGGEYWRTVSRDELHFLDHAYGAPLQFVEVGPNDEAMITVDVFGTPGGPSGGTLGVGGPDTSELRVPGDASQGRRILTASVGISASAAIGIMAKSQAWDVTNNSGQAIEAISIRARGSSKPGALSATSSGAHRFTTYEPSLAFAPQLLEDRAHHFLDPVGGSFPSGHTIQIGLQIDVWDWTVSSARARSVGGEIFDITLAPPGIGSWFHHQAGTPVEPPFEGDGLLPGLLGASLIDVPAVGFVVQGVEDARTTITDIAIGQVGDPFLGPSDLGADLLANLRAAGSLHEFSIGELELGADQEFVFVLRGGENDLPAELRASNRYMLLDLPDLADDPLVVYVRSETDDFMIGSYALLNSGLIRVPEPAALTLLAMAAAFVMLRRRRGG